MIGTYGSAVFEVVSCQETCDSDGRSILVSIIPARGHVRKIYEAIANKKDGLMVEMKPPFHQAPGFKPIVRAYSGLDVRDVVLQVLPTGRSISMLDSRGTTRQDLLPNSSVSMLLKCYFDSSEDSKEVELEHPGEPESAEQFVCSFARQF